MGSQYFSASMVSLLVLLTDELIRSQTMLETQLARGGSLTTEKN
jgi:hypothetical protein